MNTCTLAPFGERRNLDPRAEFFPGNIVASFVPQTEDHPLRPLSPYGCAKLAVEYYLDYFLQVQGLSSVALRYANVYGPRQNSGGESGVVAILARRLLQGKEVTLHGDGRQTRDFVYAGDGVETSINELYGLLCNLTGVARPAPRNRSGAPEKPACPRGWRRR